MCPKTRIPIQMMNLGRVTAGEARHRFQALPVGNRHELGFHLSILAQGLNSHSFLDQRLDPNSKLYFWYSSARSRFTRPRQIRAIAGFFDASFAD